jgi:hypothetical protein
MIRNVVRLARWTAVAVMALAVPGALAAQDSATERNHLYDKFSASIDFTTVLNNSSARVDGSSGQGTEINFKDRLGISGSVVQPALTFAWKPGRHTELDVGYQWINQSGNRTLSDAIIVGNDTVSADFDLNTKLGSNNANLAFKYSLWAAERHNIGLELGLGAIFFDLQMDATAHGCIGTACDTGAVSIHKSVTAPTGAVGAFGQWRLGERWYVGADARGIGGRVDRYDVSIFQADAFAKYYFSNRWGAAAGWYFNDVTVNIAPKGGNSATSDVAGKVSFNYTSLRLGVTYAF